MVPKENFPADIPAKPLMVVLLHVIVFVTEPSFQNVIPSKPESYQAWPLTGALGDAAEAVNVKDEYTVLEAANVNEPLFIVAPVFAHEKMVVEFGDIKILFVQSTEAVPVLSYAILELILIELAATLSTKKFVTANVPAIDMAEAVWVIMLLPITLVPVNIAILPAVPLPVTPPLWALSLFIRYSV